MADITVTATKVGRPFPEKDLVFDFLAAEAITAGQPVYLTSAGKAGVADANVAGKDRLIGIALNKAGAGQAVSVIQKGHIEGFALSGMAYDAPAFLSDTAGALADAPGTKSIRVGRVTSVPNKDVAKLLYIETDFILPKVFVSAELTGTGAVQNTAHGLGVTPKQVFIALTGGPAAYAQPTITEGVHDATNVVATVTTGWKYRIIAIAA